MVSRAWLGGWTCLGAAFFGHWLSLRPLGHPDLPPACVVIIMAAHKHMADRTLLPPLRGDNVGGGTLVSSWQELSEPMWNFPLPWQPKIFLTVSSPSTPGLKGRNTLQPPCMDTKSDLETDLDCLGSETCGLCPAASSTFFG